MLFNVKKNDKINGKIDIQYQALRMTKFHGEKHSSRGKKQTRWRHWRTWTWQLGKFEGNIKREEKSRNIFKARPNLMMKHTVHVRIIFRYKLPSFHSLRHVMSLFLHILKCFSYLTSKLITNKLQWKACQWYEKNAEWEKKSEEKEQWTKTQKAPRWAKNYGLLSIFIFDFIVFLPPHLMKNEEKDINGFVDQE